MEKSYRIVTLTIYKNPHTATTGLATLDIGANTLIPGGIIFQWGNKKARRLVSLTHCVGKKLGKRKILLVNPEQYRCAYKQRFSMPIEIDLFAFDDLLKS
jgi:hypothetical protein